MSIPYIFIGVNFGVFSVTLLYKVLMNHESACVLHVIICKITSFLLLTGRTTRRVGNKYKVVMKYLR